MKKARKVEGLGVGSCGSIPLVEGMEMPFVGEDNGVASEGSRKNSNCGISVARVLSAKD